MSKFTKNLVDELADKLLIGLTPEENDLVLNEFETIDKQMELISNMSNISKVTPMTHCLDDFDYELSEDIPEKSVSIEELLQNCDEYEGREISVPKVVS